MTSQPVCMDPEPIRGTSAAIKSSTLASGGWQEGVARVSDEALTSQ